MVPDDVSAAWERVTEQWDDSTRHETFFALAARHNCFAWAAKRYRERAGDAVADKQLARITRAVTATLLTTATRQPDKPSPYRTTILVLICLLGAMVFGLLLTKQLHDNTPRITKPSRH